MAPPLNKGKAIARALSRARLRRAPLKTAKGDNQVQNFIDKMPGAVFIFTGEKNRLVNAAAEALTGYSRKELLQMDLGRIIRSDFRDALKRRGPRRPWDPQPAPRYELKIIRKDGAERWLDYSEAPFRFRGKTATIGTATDITERKSAEARLQQSLNHLRALQDTRVGVMSTLELENILNVVLEEFAALLPCPAGSAIRVVNSQTGSLEAKALRNIPREWQERIPEGGRGLSKAVLESKRPVMVVDACADPRTTHPEFFKSNGFVSYLGVPLIFGGTVLGYVSVFTKKKHEYGDAEIELLTSLASQAAVAIHNSRLYDEMKRRTNGLAALNALTAATTQSLDLNSVLNEAVKSIAELFQLDGARIYLFDEPMDEAHLRSSFETDPGPWNRVKVIPITEGIIGKVAKTAEPVIFPDILADPRYDELSQTGGVKRAGGRFFGVFPVRSRLKSWGSLSCVARQPRRLSAEEIALLVAMCNQIGIAIENASLYQNTAARAKELSALYAIAGISAQFVDMNALLYQSMRKVCDIFGLTAGRIYILDEERQTIRLVAQEGFPDSAPPPATYRIGEGGLGVVIEKGLPLAFADIQNDSEYRAVAQTQFMLKAGFRGCVFIPLKVRGKTLGVMNLGTREVRAFSGSDMQLINAIAYHLGIAVGNANLFAQLRQKTSDLERANKAKDEFLSIMSHELRTPLNLILGYTDLMAQGMFGELNPELGAAAAKIAANTRELLSMIESILVTTSIETGTISLTKTEFPLPDLLDRLKSIYELPLDKDVRLIWSFPSVAVLMKTDFEKLKRILQNLIDNAIKFTPKGSITVSARLEAAARKVSFSVSDTGIGIESEHTSAIFDIFRQLDSSATRSHGGVGLGLYIVKQLTEVLGGSVTVKSAPGKGSTFTVTVPVES